MAKGPSRSHYQTIHLEYCKSVWAPYKKGNLEALEEVQEKPTKLIRSLRHKNYAELLKICHLTSLLFPRLQGDMIATDKIITGK